MDRMFVTTDHGQVVGLNGRWVAAPSQAAMRRLPAVAPFRGYERQLSSAANATFRPLWKDFHMGRVQTECSRAGKRS